MGPRRRPWEKEAFMDTHVKLFQEILGALVASEEWTRITYEDPAINEEEAQLEEVMKRLSALVPDELRCELDDAACNVRSAYVDAAILFGMRVAQLRQRAPENPEQFTEYTARRAAERRTTA